LTYPNSMQTTIGRGIKKKGRSEARTNDQHGKHNKGLPRARKMSGEALRIEGERTKHRTTTTITRHAIGENYQQREEREHRARDGKGKRVAIDGKQKNLSN